MRKLLTILNAMVRDGQPWRAQPHIAWLQTQLLSLRERGWGEGSGNARTSRSTGTLIRPSGTFSRREKV